jgi:ribokinase
MTVFVVGNCAVDIVLPVPRLPRPGETVLADGRLVDLGGKGANQAVVLARSAVPTVCGAVLGEDSEAAFARERLAREPFADLRLLSAAVPTDQSIITVTPGGENAIVSTALAARSLGPAQADMMLEGLGAGDTLLMQGNLSAETTLHCLKAARRAGARTALNPAPIQFDYAPLWPLTDIAILNEVELRDLAGGAGDAAARRLSDRGVGTLIVTLGAAGAVAYEGDEKLTVPAPRVEAVDTAGAGDVFCGVLAAGLALGRSLRTAMEAAVAAASESVTRPGTQSSFPSAPELAALLNATSGGMHERV